MKEAGVPFGYSITETHDNLEEVLSDEFVDFMINKGAKIAWYFQYIPVGRAPDISMMLTPEQRMRSYDRVHAIRSGKPLFAADFWNDGPYVGGCIAAGRRYLHINHKGDIEPCAFIHFAVDNIKEKPLVEALRSPFFEYIRKRIPYTSNLFAPCAIIDNPWILRRAVQISGAHPTHEGADQIFKPPIKDYIDEYAHQHQRLSLQDWKEWKEKRLQEIKSLEEVAS